MARVEQVIRDIPTTLAKVADALGNKLTFQENLRTKTVPPLDAPVNTTPADMNPDNEFTGVTPSGADVEFRVTHNLGAVPRGYIANVDKSAVVYDSRRSEWSVKVMYLKCSAGTVTLYLIVF